MTAKIPGTDIALQSGTDADSLRWSVRDDSTQGYVFLSTYQPDVAPLQGHKGLQLHVPLGSGPSPCRAPQWTSPPESPRSGR